MKIGKVTHNPNRWKKRAESSEIEIKNLKAKLEEAQNTLSAIQRGEVDTLVAHGERLYTRQCAEQPYRTLVETMNEGAVTLSEKGIIFYCNQRFSEMLKTPLEKVIGSSIFDWISPDESHEFKTAFEGGKRYGKQGAFLLKAGDTESVSSLLSLSPAQVQGCPGACVIATDLTESKKLEQARSEVERLKQVEKNEEQFRLVQKKSLEEVKQALAFRDEFLAIASHELKTPLTSLQLSIQSLGRILSNATSGVLPMDRLTRSSEVISKEIKRLGILIDDLLDVSRISAGKLSLNLEPTSLLGLIDEVLLRDEERLRMAQVQIEKLIQQDVTLTIDKLRIDQVITNLISNAIKYAPGKPLQIHLETDGAKVSLGVFDQGPGIPKGFETRIFDRFERAVAGATAISGLGLGLFISKQIVEAHQGKIQVKTERGKGACFMIELPIIGSRSSLLR